VILSFADKETEKVYNQVFSRQLPQNIQRLAMRKLWMLGSAVSLADIESSQGNRLEALKGNRKGQHSIRINDQWRICFVWKTGCASHVEIVDYH